jgi:Glycosyl transferases group 1
MHDLSTLKLVEIGAKPYVKSAFPAQRTYFSTEFVAPRTDSAAGVYPFSLSAFAKLVQALRDPDLSLILCHPSYYSPWHWRWISRALFDRRTLQGHVPLVRVCGPQVLRFAVTAPIAVLDTDDLPVINRSNFFLLDRCRLFFKRELPPDRWKVFLKTAHPNLPTPRFRQGRRYQAWIDKLRPVSLGLPLRDAEFVPPERTEKKVDVFFAGRIDGASSVRTRGIAELRSLRQSGVTLDIPDRRLSPAEFYHRCAAAWLTWSPEGLGWDCFRHYEASACGSVPLINQPSIERHRPLQDQEHAIYYDVEEGGLSSAVLAALGDKPRLAKMALAAQEHVLAHHTPTALSTYVIRETLSHQVREAARLSAATAE